MDDLSLTIRSALIALNKLAVADVQFTIVKDNTSKAIASALFEGKLAAGDGELGVGLVFDGIQAAGVVAAVDRQITVVVDHGRAGVASGSGDILKDQVGIAVLRDLDVVVAGAANHSTVLDRNRAAGHRDGGLTGVGVRQRLAVEVEGDARGDGHILGAVSKQGHGVAVLRCLDGIVEGGVARFADFGSIGGRSSRALNHGGIRRVIISVILFGRAAVCFGRGILPARALCLDICIRLGDHAHQHGQTEQQRQELACDMFHTLPPMI